MFSGKPFEVLVDSLIWDSPVNEHRSDGSNWYSGDEHTCVSNHSSSGNKSEDDGEENACHSNHSSSGDKHKDDGIIVLSD